MVNTMARRTDGGVRFRPVGSRRSRTAPVYSPRGTGCPAIEQAVQGLYKGQNEESFWALMSALNYALELETHVLVPLQTALSAQGAPAPWMEHPIPAEKADGLALWTLRNDKGRCWLPLFTSVAAAGADRSTGSRPMADRTLEQAMQLALDTPGIDGVVLDPWSNSASLDGALLNGLLHAGHTVDARGVQRQLHGLLQGAVSHGAAAGTAVRTGRCHRGEQRQPAAPFIVAQRPQGKAVGLFRRDGVLHPRGGRTLRRKRRLQRHKHMGLQFQRIVQSAH